MSEARSFDEFKVGESATLIHVISADDVAGFVALTGDNNPVHVDDKFAVEIGIKGRVVHGMLTAGFVSTVIGTLLPGSGALWLSERFEFRAPVFVNDRIRVEVSIRHVSPATRVLVLDVRVWNQDDKVVLDGEANVQVLERKREMEEEERSARVAIVTGSGRGIGAAIAERLATDGLSVIVNYRHKDDTARETVRLIEVAGGTASVFQADVSDQDGATSLVAFATEKYGPVDVLINNAGGSTNPRRITDMTWQDVEDHLYSHLRSAFLCSGEALPGMLQRRFGRIVNVTSQSAYGQPPPKMTGYVVAKSALAAFTRCLAVEGSPSGVTANAVAPGMADTALVADIPQRTKLALAAQSPLRRLVRVNEIAEVVSFLAGPGGSSVTGQTVHLSGGQVMS